MKRLRRIRQEPDTEGWIVAGDAMRCPNEIVYGYQFPSKSDRIKIGYSGRGLKRIKEQSTAFPEKPKILFVIHDDAARAIEGELHKSLAKFQANDTMGTEWFKVSLEQVIRVSDHLSTALGRKRKLGKVKVGLFFVVPILWLLFVPIVDVLMFVASTDLTLAKGMSWIHAYLWELVTLQLLWPTRLIEVFGTVLTAVSFMSWLLSLPLLGVALLRLHRWTP